MIKMTDADIVQTGFAIADGKMGYKELVDWVNYS